MAIDRRLAVGAALLLTLSTAAATDATHHAPKAPPKATTTLNQHYVWYDGDEPRTVWLDPYLVADFTREPAHAAALKRAFPRAQALTRRHAGMRLWKADERVGASETVRTLSATTATDDYSPVLRDAPSEEAPLRALPGNVIVYFEPDWDEARVRAWVHAQGLTIVKRLEIGRNVYVLETEAGLAALETANRLYLSGDVVAAFPDWWREVVPR